MKPRFSAEEVKTLTRCIFELEARTSAEVVLVIRGASGKYRNADLLGGAVLAGVTLGYLLLAPYEFHYVSIPLPMGLAFILGWRLSPYWGIRRLLTSSGGRHRRVVEETRRIYETREVGKTSHHQGILIYCSLLERESVIFSDKRARELLNSAEHSRFERAFAKAASSRKPARHIASALRGFGVRLGRVMPADGNSGRRELSNEIDGEDRSL